MRKNESKIKIVKKMAKVENYVEDTEKRTVDVLKRQVSFELLDEKKHFRLKKHLSNLKLVVELEE